MKMSVTMDDIITAAKAVGIELTDAEKSELLLRLQKQVDSFAVIDGVDTDGIVAEFGANGGGNNE